jgi:hypothetical protein
MGIMRDARNFEQDGYFAQTLIATSLFGQIIPTMLAWTSRLFPSTKGFATGVVYGSGFLGVVFAPWFTGVVARFFSLSASILYLAMSSLAVALSVLLMRLNMNVLSKRGW